MPTESTFLLAGLFLLLAAAGWAMGRFGERDEEQPPAPLNIDYLKGLNFLLNEQTDQALEHFLEMVRVDDKTIETHFALGSLFRRRGEVDRAIRIHQNIIARPDLAAEQRDQALYSLAKDYLHAGLLDRAENLFSRLSQGSRYQVQALESLCRIYEQEKEWERAIDAAEKLFCRSRIRQESTDWPPKNDAGRADPGAYRSGDPRQQDRPASLPPYHR
jgi:lipopolysaccharide biosynthesis regulator YciM